MKKTDNLILFVDESGKSKLSDEGDYFLLCGLIIDKDLHTALSSYMLSLKEKSNISPDENIHAFNLFEDEKLKSGKITHSQISTFFTRVSHLVQGSEIRCLVVRMDKKPYKKTINKLAKKMKVSSRAIINYLKRGGLHDFLYEAMARKIILQFGHLLELEGAHGEVMAESRRQDDHAVLEAFISATQTSKYKDGTIYHSWSRDSFKRIHGLTFQNKKGLSFGLELADIFAWAHLNKHYGRTRIYKSKAKNKRIETRLEKVETLMKSLYLKKKPEDITRSKLKTLAGDRISEFTEALECYATPSVSSGTPPGNPDGPYPDTNKTSA